MRKKVVHLIDDTTPGGVMRVLSHFEKSAELAENFEHEILPVKRGSIRGIPKDAEVIVSHLSISWRSLPALIVMRAKHAAKTLIHVEHSYTEGFVAENVGNTGRFGTLLGVAYSLFDKVVSVSHAQGEWLKSAGYVAAETLHVVQSAVEVDPFLQLPPHEGAIHNLAALGRFDRQKGFDILIKALVQNPDLNVTLTLTGEGSEEPALRSLAAGDPRIKFEPFSPTPESVFSKADAVLMPSRWEAYGLVALEARASGRALLVSNIDGLRDHAAAGAIQVDENTPEQWAIAMDALTRGDLSPKSTIDAARTQASKATQDFVQGWIAVLG
ncbi:MAG: glycosyltransferase family 4 protein [Planktomarina sp.]